MTDDDKNPEEYGVESTKVLSGLEAVRKRPGMYIGELDWKGALNNLDLVVDVIIGLSASAARKSWQRGFFRYYAKLHVIGKGHKFNVYLFHNPAEIDDFECRKEELLREKDQFDWEKGTILIPRGVSDQFRIEFRSSDSTNTIYTENPNDPAAPPLLNDTGWSNSLTASYQLRDIFSLSGLTTDKILGFLQSSRKFWPGLLIETVKYEKA